jgi:hypothetical protein
MRRKDNLPPSPLAPRQKVNFELSDPKQYRATAEYQRSRLRSLAREKDKYPNEFDRLIADVEARCGDILAEERLEPGAGVSDERYPEPIWYAGQIIDRTAEIRDLRDHNPDLAIAAALVLGHLIGEAQAHLSLGEDAARGV